MANATRVTFEVLAEMLEFVARGEKGVVRVTTSGKQAMGQALASLRRGHAGERWYGVVLKSELLEGEEWYEGENGGTVKWKLWLAPREAKARVTGRVAAERVQSEGAMGDGGWKRPKTEREMDEFVRKAEEMLDAEAEKTVAKGAMWWPPKGDGAKRLYVPWWLGAKDGRKAIWLPPSDEWRAEWSGEWADWMAKARDAQEKAGFGEVELGDDLDTGYAWLVAILRGAVDEAEEILRRRASAASKDGGESAEDGDVGGDPSESPTEHTPQGELPAFPDAALARAVVAIASEPKRRG